MVFVYFEITSASECQRKSAVFGDLFQHVIVITDSGIDFGWPFPIKVNRYPDIRFLGFAINRRNTRLFENIAYHSIPGTWIVGVNFETSDADVVS